MMLMLKEMLLLEEDVDVDEKLMLLMKNVDWSLL
jgi:hypothetical protein